MIILPKPLRPPRPSAPLLALRLNRCPHSFPLPRWVQGRTEHLLWNPALKGRLGVRSPLRGLLALTPGPSPTGAGEGSGESSVEALHSD